MHRPFAILAAAALMAGLAGCTAGAEGEEAGDLRPARVEPFSIDVQGEQAHGLVARPGHGHEPTTLVVLAHPWATGADVFQPELERLAQAGVLAVAMEFRGDRGAFKVATGVADTLAATAALQDAHSTIDRTLLYGWSMGGEVALLAVAQAPPGTYDYVLVGAGVSDLAALWHSFVAARPAIERETGGTPTDVPEQYTTRSPVERVADLEGKGVSRYFLVHGAGDAPVPVEQAERLYSKMAESSLPVSYYVVTMNQDPWLCTPVVTVCSESPPKGVANHEAGGLRLMQPFLDHRIGRLPDPAVGAARGTYDGDTGHYEPSDVGS